MPLHAYLARHGSPIRYAYVRERWPIECYQTVYATEPGSAEMPSAGRAFTPELITGLVAHGVQIAPLVLHTGVSSLDGAAGERDARGGRTDHRGRDDGGAGAGDGDGWARGHASRRGVDVARRDT